MYYIIKKLQKEVLIMNLLLMLSLVFSSLVFADTKPTYTEAELQRDLKNLKERMAQCQEKPGDRCFIDVALYGWEISMQKFHETCELYILACTQTMPTKEDDTLSLRNQSYFNEAHCSIKGYRNLFKEVSLLKTLWLESQRGKISEEKNSSVIEKVTMQKLQDICENNTQYHQELAAHVYKHIFQFQPATGIPGTQAIACMVLQGSLITPEPRKTPPTAAENPDKIPPSPYK
jgi:hypothetical protein